MRGAPGGRSIAADAFLVSPCPLVNLHYRSLRSDWDAPFLRQDKLKRAPTTAGADSVTCSAEFYFFRTHPLPPGFPDLFIPKSLSLMDLGSAHSEGVSGGLAYCLRKRLKNGMLWRSMAS